MKVVNHFKIKEVDLQILALWTRHNLLRRLMLEVETGIP